MHIAFFYQYYHTPDCSATSRHYTFLRRWAERHRITLFTTRHWFERRLTDRFPWAPDGVDVRMFDVPYDNAMTPADRLRAFGAYAWHAVREGRRMDRPDVVFGTSTPLTAAAAAERVAAHHGVPWAFEVRDLWPDFPVQMGALRNGLARRAAYALERHLYRSAAHVFPLSPDMAAHVASHGTPPERITMHYNGTDFDLLDATPPEAPARLRAAHGLEGKRVVLYAGTFGRANAIPEALALAEALRDDDGVRFVLLGHGFYQQGLEAAAAALPNVVVVPPAPHHAIFAWFQLADLTLVSFIDRPVLATNSPAKFYDSLACGTPTLVTNPGWTRRFVEEHGCGYYAPIADPAALAATVRRALADPEANRARGARGAAVARRLFDRAAIADDVERVLVELAGARPPRSAAAA